MQSPARPVPRRRFPLLSRSAASALLAASGLALLLAGCAGEASPAPRAPEKVAKVRVVEVQPRPTEEKIVEVGTVQAENRVVVASQEAGTVTFLAVREGDRVAAGDLVATLDDREITAQLAEAESRRVEAEASHRRAGSLRDAGLLPAADFEATTATLEVARARADLLRTRLSFTRVTAPVAGIVTVRHVELGDTVAARSPLVELASGQHVLRVPVSELAVVKLAVGDPARVRVDALPDATIDARLGRIFPAADPASRQVTVELILEDLPPGLRLGFLARAELVVDRVADALMVPEAAVLRGSELPTYVWVVDGDTAHMRGVEVGLRQDGEARILEGLVPGERVVVEGTSSLVEGGRVEIEEAA